MRLLLLAFVIALSTVSGCVCGHRDVYLTEPADDGTSGDPR